MGTPSPDLVRQWIVWVRHLTMVTQTITTIVMAAQMDHRIRIIQIINRPIHIRIICHRIVQIMASNRTVRRGNVGVYR